VPGLSRRRLAPALIAITLAALPACLGPASSSAAASGPPYLDSHLPAPERAADLVSRMTLVEKAEELSSNYAAPIPRLGVQTYAWWNEYQHGVNTLFGNLVCGAPTCENGTTGYVGSRSGPPATSFPTNQAATMSWDPALTYQETTAISDEARGFLDKSLYGTGVNNLGPLQSDYGSLSFYAPNVNLMRDPRWGRNNEAFGEDPLLVARMADAYVDGAQGETMSGRPLTPYLKTIAVAKHYALNTEENDRMTGSSDTTDANIRDYYTKQFASVIEQAHVGGLMSSYNAINGTPSPVDTYTLNELAQRTYGFAGYVSSDCPANTTAYGPAPFHNWLAPGWSAVGAPGANAAWTNHTTGQVVSAPAGGEAYALRAGTGVDCIGPEANAVSISEAIRAGVLSEGVLDTALVRMFTDRIRTGEFDPAAKVAWTRITKATIQSPAHTALARRQADEDIVLLKNSRVHGSRSPLLPLDPVRPKSVVIVGNLAGTVTLGGYSGNPGTQVDAVQGITQRLKRANPRATVTYDACGTSTTTTKPAACSPATLAAIKAASLVVVFVGTDLNVAQEGSDAKNIAMPGNYDSLIAQAAAVGNPRMVLAIQAALPVTLGNVQQHFPAIVFSGYNGEEQGNALADVLFGRQDPSGHLDFTWFASSGQLPPISDYGLTPAQTGGLGRTYMYFTGKPTYPFGFGLSFTRFRLSHLHVSARRASANGSLRVSFTVTNTGRRAGATVPQLYAAPRLRSSVLALPLRQLVGFQRTRVLRPHRSQRITLTVSIPGLSRWDESELREVVPDGRWSLELSTAAGRTVAARNVLLGGHLTPRVRYVTVQPDQVELKVGQALDLTGTNPWIAPDTNSALEQRHAPGAGIVEAVDNDESFADLSRASVRYASSDPQVATVSDAGLIRAVGSGVTTVTVTVNGVSGSTPIVVS
jgi:beta-glucosidase